MYKEKCLGMMQVDIYVCTATKVAAHVSDPDASYKVDLALWL